jgi:hypothetical protein
VSPAAPPQAENTSAASVNISVVRFINCLLQVRDLHRTKSTSDVLILSIANAW